MRVIAITNYYCDAVDKDNCIDQVCELIWVEEGFQHWKGATALWFFWDFFVALAGLYLTCSKQLVVWMFLHLFSQGFQPYVVLSDLFLLGFFPQFLPEIAQKHCYIQSREHHIRNEDDYNEKEHSWPSNSCIVLVHHRWPILVEEKIENAEKWWGEALEVVDERRSILNINVTLRVEPNFIGKKQLSDLFEHDGETETK